VRGEGEVPEPRGKAGQERLRPGHVFHRWPPGCVRPSYGRRSSGRGAPHPAVRRDRRPPVYTCGGASTCPKMRYWCGTPAPELAPCPKRRGIAVIAASSPRPRSAAVGPPVPREQPPPLSAEQELVRP